MKLKGIRLFLGDETTLGEVRDAIDKAYLEGWESEDSFFLALDVENEKDILHPKK